MNFSEKIIAIEDEARNFILSKVKDNEVLELISKEDLDNLEDDERLWDLPSVEIINKYNESCTYAIIAIDRKGESIDLKGYGLGEYLGESYIFSPYELTANQICYLADYLK
jgi:hypothetical protein